MLITNFSKASLSLLNSLKRYTESFLNDAEIWNQVLQGCLSCVSMPSHIGVMFNMMTVSWRTSMSQGAVHT